MARRLLLDESPLILLPSLAAQLGVNEALILQQFNYWIQGSKNEWEGKFWTFNSYSEWRKQFPFLSVPTIGRAIRKLERMGLLISKVGPNKKKFDRTKWYRIDQGKFDELFPEHTPVNQDGTDLNQDGIKLAHSLASPTYQNEPTIPEKTTTETSSERVTSLKKTFAPKLHKRQIFAKMQLALGYLNKTDKDPIPNYGKEAKAIERMVARGYTEEEILECWKKKVTDRGEFVSMVYVNEDIGKPDRKPRQASLLPTEDELIAQAKERGLG